MVVNEDGKSRVDWKVFIAACSLLVAIISGGVYAIVTPMRQQLDALREQVSQMTEARDKMMVREAEVTDLKIKAPSQLFDTKLVEIETQFRAMDQSRNVQFATQQITDALLWEKVFGSRYPSDAIYYPNISK